MTRRFLHTVFLLLVWIVPAASQTSGEDEEFLRAHWEEIADSVLTRLGRNNVPDVWLIVDTPTAKTLIENVFLERFQQKGAIIILQGEETGGSVPQLRVSGIHMTRTSKPGEADDAAIRTECEVRLEKGNGEARFLGRFEKESPADLPGRASGMNVIDRVLEPLVVIAGAVMIVYLFFTVRS